MSLATAPALGLAAGALSTLSPCVLPLLPVVAGSAVAAHRRGPLALAAGLAISFAAIGIFVATAGFALGLTGGVFRVVAGVLMAGFGIVLLSASLQARFTTALAAIEAKAGAAAAGLKGDGLAGQFAIGLLLGAVWSPCSGPTLGSAALLAAQQKNLLEVAFTMVGFGLGAAIPLLIVGSLSRTALKRWRGKLLEAGGWGRRAMGIAMLAVGVLVLSGADKQIEAAFVANSPEWLVELSGLV